jgi:hypothetical protein
MQAGVIRHSQARPNQQHRASLYAQSNPSRRRRSRFCSEGSTVVARVTRAARFGRSLTLPPLSDAPCLEQSFSSSSSSSFSICSGGSTVASRVTRAARFGRSLALPPLSVALMPRSDRRPVAPARDGRLDNNYVNSDKKARPRKLCAYLLPLHGRLFRCLNRSGRYEGFL